MAGPKKVRVICTDPDATDSSSDEESSCTKGAGGAKRVVREILVPQEYFSWERDGHFFPSLTRTEFPGIGKTLLTKKKSMNKRRSSSSTNTAVNPSSSEMTYSPIKKMLWPRKSGANRFNRGARSGKKSEMHIRAISKGAYPGSLSVLSEATAASFPLQLPADYELALLCNDDDSGFFDEVICDFAGLTDDLDAAGTDSSCSGPMDTEESSNIADLNTELAAMAGGCFPRINSPSSVLEASASSCDSPAASGLSGFQASDTNSLAEPAQPWAALGSLLPPEASDSYFEADLKDVLDLSLFDDVSSPSLSQAKGNGDFFESLDFLNDGDLLADDSFDLDVESMAWVNLTEACGCS